MERQFPGNGLLKSMVSLRPIPYSAIERYKQDFHKKSHTYETVPPHCQLLGIFDGEALAGYFVVAGYEDGDLEINQGYLNKEYRHKRLSACAMQLLEQRAKDSGFKKIILASSRSLKAYTQFMANMGYAPERIIFSKVV